MSLKLYSLWKGRILRLWSCNSHPEASWRILLLICIKREECKTHQKRFDLHIFGHVSVEGELCMSVAADSRDPKLFHIEASSAILYLCAEESIYVYWICSCKWPWAQQSVAVAHSAQHYWTSVIFGWGKKTFKSAWQFVDFESHYWSQCPHQPCLCQGPGPPPHQWQPPLPWEGGHQVQQWAR